jgi:hypothetical protein
VSADSPANTIPPAVPIDLYLVQSIASALDAGDVAGARELCRAAIAAHVPPVERWTHEDRALLTPFLRSAKR